MVGFYFFNDTATTEIYTLSLHDALPIFPHQPGQPGALRAHHQRDRVGEAVVLVQVDVAVTGQAHGLQAAVLVRSEEHTSELQSRQYLVCRLLLEKKKKMKYIQSYSTTNR